MPRIKGILGGERWVVGWGTEEERKDVGDE